MKITLTTTKSAIFEEVARSTHYLAAKMRVTEETPNEYDRIPTIDEDDDILTRFWNESKNSLISYFANILLSETDENDEYELGLKVSLDYNLNLNNRLNDTLFSYFVANIVAKWLLLIGNADFATIYAQQAESEVANISYILQSHIGKIRRPLKPF